MLPHKKRGSIMRGIFTSIIVAILIFSVCGCGSSGGGGGGGASPPANSAPYWTSTPSNVMVDNNVLYNTANGSAGDNDEPSGTAGEPGYIECSAQNSTCPFGVTVTGNGAGVVTCNMSFTSGSTSETCNVDVLVTDGRGESVVKNITISVRNVWYADDSAAGSNNGTSWDDAFTVVQDAMDAATSEEVIWVAEGTYTNASGIATREVLLMKDGVEVYGGFIANENSLSERGNPADNPAVLDGENLSYHVVVSASDARLDGFTVTRGNASGADPNDRGGGMYNYLHINLVVANCTFRDNSGTIGAAMFNESLVPTIINCVFTNNSATSVAGAIYNLLSSPVITNCVFYSNSAESLGGAIVNEESLPLYINCVFAGNSAILNGGAMLDSDSNSTLTNCIMWGNYAPTGPVVSVYSTTIGDPYTLTISYSDVQGGQASVFVGADCTLNWGADMLETDPLFLNAPDFWDVTTAAGSTTTVVVADATLYAVGDVVEIDNDGTPRTVIAAVVDTVTFSPALSTPSTAGMLVGNWGVGATDLVEDFHLDTGPPPSPCINTGDPNPAYNDPDGTRNDMGAYGGPDAQ